MHYGEADEFDLLSAEDYLPTLPNTHFADLLAAQLRLLMMREGYKVDDHIQPRPICTNIASSNQPNVSGGPPNNSAIEVKQYNEAVPVQPCNDLKPTLGGNASFNSSHNLLANTRMLPSGNPQSLVSGISVPARSQQLDPHHSLLQQQQQQQQQHALMHQQNSQFQRSQMVLPSNSLSHLGAIGPNSNMQLGGHLVNKSSLQQLQQHQHQQQQQQQLQQPQSQQLQQPQSQQLQQQHQQSQQHQQLQQHQQQQLQQQQLLQKQQQQQLLQQKQQLLQQQQQQQLLQQQQHQHQQQQQQLQQLQPQQQQLPQMQQRKMMMGPGTAMGMGSMGE
ncbi:hypothetical protein OIU78_014299 [Salix suchowensis]|nr:hypothetical protein OIU78_014299 [Salix suchowensis]